MRFSWTPLLLGLLSLACARTAPVALPAPVPAAAASAPVPPPDPSSPAAAAAPSEAHVLYLGTKTDVEVFGFDAETGALRPKQRIPMGVRTVYLAVHPNRRFLYASHGEAPGRIVAFAIDPTTGLLRRINDGSTADQGDATGTSHLAVHPSGKWIMTAHLASGRVSVVGIGAGGAVGPVTDTRIFAVGAHQMVFDRAGRYVYVPVRDGQFVGQFRVDVDAGKLVALSPDRVASLPRSGPRHIAFTPDERFAFVNNESNGTVTGYAYDSAAGQLVRKDTVPSVPPDFNETGMGHVQVHPNGKFVYASNRFHNSIAVYALDQAGALQTVQIENGAGELHFPRDFTLDPSGRRMIVGNERGHTVSVFSVDPATGRLGKLARPVATTMGPQVVVLVPLR
jgi:6-phosphogluconolactonase